MENEARRKVYASRMTNEIVNKSPDEKFSLLTFDFSY
jgi:hypothetical protein